MIKRIKAGLVTNLTNTIELFSKGLSPFTIVLGDGWASAGGRAFTFVGPQAGSPAVTLSPVTPAGVYSIQINVTTLAGAGSLVVALGGTTVFTITEPGAHSVDKAIAGAGTTFTITVTTGATVTGATVKSLFINRVD